MSSAIVSDVFYVTHEMVAFKAKLNETKIQIWINSRTVLLYEKSIQSL